MKTRSWPAIAAAGALLLGGVGCGDDGDGDAASATTSSAAATDEYCDLSRELDEQQALPTAEQLEAILAVAPDEIRDDAQVVVDALLAGIEAGDLEAAFGEPELDEPFTRINDFDRAECGFDAEEGEGEGASGEIPAELVDYCALATELAAQEDFPTAEQLTAYQELAPTDIQAPVGVAVPAFLEAIEAGDFGLAFADPEASAALEEISAFEAETCGIEAGAGGDQDPSITEPDPDATQVAVSATEYAFDFDVQGAGRTTFTMTNEGRESHVMVLFQVADGATVDDVLEGDSEDPEIVAAGYRSNVALPGEDVYLTADLVPAEYVALCYLPNPDGTAHADLGMLTTFTVG